MKYPPVKYLLFFTLILVVSAAVFSQTPKAKPTPKKAAKPVATPTPPGETEDELFAKAQNETTLADRSKALKNFLEKFPDSTHKVRAQELLASARAQEADTQIRAGDTAGGIALFELAVKESPTPLSDKFFHGVLYLIPNNLRYVNETAAAIKIANLIEEKAGNSASQLLDLAKFHLGVESAIDARRAAEKAVAIDPNSAAGYEMLGQAFRMNLQLEEAATAYEKGLQTNTRLLSTVLYLADAKRALGKADESIPLYKEALEKDPENSSARAGLVIATFDAGKRSDAEAELKRALTANPKNFVLMAGVAYWYAAHNEADKAVDMARQAIAVEPRFVWSYVAQSRGLTLQGRPADAERVMLQASQYGNFPTVNYERASAKYAVGFYEEAATDLRRSFDIKEGKLRVNLAGRVFQTGDSFIEILAKERLASIYEATGADSPENSAKLRNLLAFEQYFNDKDAKEADIISAAEAFVGEKDSMQPFRQLYVANKMLQKRLSPARAAEFAQAAVGGLESSVKMPGATLAVLAEELLEPRAAALTRGSTVAVADVAPLVLLNILRGRVEELSGWALFQQQKPDEALVRLRRAITVLPENSIWWRTSLWKLGVVLDTGGKSEEAFAAYSKSYTSGSQDQLKWATLQGICQRLYNTTDDCETKVAVAAKASGTAKTTGSSLLKDSSKPANSPVSGGDSGAVESTPSPTPDSTLIKPTTTPDPSPAAEPTLLPSPVQTKEAQNTSEIKPEPAVLTTSDAVAKSSEPGRQRTVTKSPESKTGVVYSNPTAQVHVGSPSSDGTALSCQIEISPQKLILISNGGWGSVNIDLTGEGSREEIKVSTENADDLGLELQAGIGKDIGRLVYIVRSKSSKKGEFKLIIESPCGEKKEIIVTVK